MLVEDPRSAGCWLIDPAHASVVPCRGPPARQTQSSRSASSFSAPPSLDSPPQASLPLSEGRSPGQGPTSGHVLGHDVDGLLGDHSVETDQPLMLESFHEVGLAQEGLRRHGSLLQGLDGHLDVVFIIT